MTLAAPRSCTSLMLAAATAVAVAGCRSSPSMMSGQDERLTIQVTNQSSEPLEIAAGMMALDVNSKPVGVSMINVPSVIGGYQVDIPLPPAPTSAAGETSRVVIRLRTIPPSWLEPRVQWYEVVGGVAGVYDISTSNGMNTQWADGGVAPIIQARGLPAIRVVPVPEECGGTSTNWSGSR